MADQAVRELVQVEVPSELVRKEIRGESSSWLCGTKGNALHWPVILSKSSPGMISRFRHRKLIWKESGELVEILLS